MKILITTGVYPPKIGGPAQYALNLERVWKEAGHDVKVVTYGLEEKLPPWIRHLLFLFRTLFYLPKADFCLALDTYSTGVPAMIACKLLGKQMILRVGGDFLWESYLNRTKQKILLSDFYNEKRSLSFKEKVIFHISRWCFKEASAVAFNTGWQANIFARPYSLDMNKVHVVENYYGPKQESVPPVKKNFLWHVRETFLKNADTVLGSFDTAQKKNPEIELERGLISQSELTQKIRGCYAVILPSISDVSPNYIIDALTFNKPCILTEETGLRDKLDGLVIFVDPLSDNDISEAISQLSKPEVYQEYIKRIGSFNFTHSWEEIAGEFINLGSNL